MTDHPDMLVSIRHLRAAAMCCGGGRAFFARHGLDWSRFVSRGIPAYQLLDTGDAMARRVVEKAYEEAGHHAKQ